MEAFNDEAVATFSDRLLELCQDIVRRREKQARAESQMYRRFLAKFGYAEDPLVGQSFVAIFLAAAQSTAMFSITNGFTPHQVRNIIKDLDADKSCSADAPFTLRDQLEEAHPAKVKPFAKRLVDTSSEEFRFFIRAKIPERWLHIRWPLFSHGPGYPLGKRDRNNSVLCPGYGKLSKPCSTTSEASEASSQRKRRASAGYGEIQVHGHTIAYRTLESKLLVDSMRLPLAYYGICCYEGLCNPTQAVDNQDVRVMRNTLLTILNAYDERLAQRDSVNDYVTQQARKILCDKPMDAGNAISLHTLTLAKRRCHDKTASPLTPTSVATSSSTVQLRRNGSFGSLNERHQLSVKSEPVSAAESYDGSASNSPDSSSTAIVRRDAMDQSDTSTSSTPTAFMLPKAKSKAATKPRPPVRLRPPPGLPIPDAIVKRHERQAFSQAKRDYERRRRWGKERRIKRAMDRKMAIGEPVY